MIIVTGGSGFIGSALAAALNGRGVSDILIVDQLGDDDKWKNLRNLEFAHYVEKDDFLELLLEGKLGSSVQAVLHMGACSDTTETDASFLMKNNYEYTKLLARWAADNDVRFIYASSAATYGDGSKGFSDDEQKLRELRPLNMYGYSKHLVDLWALRTGLLKTIVGLKYFNVFGPNEYHKAHMRSFVVKAYEQICDKGKVALFKSHDPKYEDGCQLRDFLYVKDAVKMTLHFLDNPNLAGIYNIGSGRARTWNDLVAAVFAAMNLPPKIEYIDMPPQIRNQYQYYTQAETKKIKKTPYKDQPTTLEEAIKDYIQNYLQSGNYLTGG